MLKIKIKIKKKPEKQATLGFIYFLLSSYSPHSSTSAWKIPWTEEPGRLQSMGLLRVRQNSETSLSLFTFMHWRRKWQPTPVFLPGESRDGGAWWAAVYGVTQSRTRLKRLSSSSIFLFSIFSLLWFLLLPPINFIFSLYFFQFLKF